MSGLPPPYPLEPTIGGPSHGSSRPPSGLSTPRVSATAHPLLPPPLPPVRGTVSTPSLPMPARAPTRRLAPLQPTESEDPSSQQRERRPSTGTFPEDSARRSPSPKNPIFDSVSEAAAPRGTPSGAQTNPLISPTASSLRRRVGGGESTPRHGHRPVGAGEGGEEEKVEELCPLQTQTRPVERFFVEYHPKDNAGDADGEDGRDLLAEDDEILFDRFAEYTDDDSFFSSSSTVLEEDPRRMQHDPLRGRVVRSVFDTLNIRSFTHGRVPQELEDEARTHAGWLYQVHQRAIALHHSSLFIFPPGMTARVVVYNLLHHWLTELLIIFVILGYSIFTASWARYTGTLHKPNFMIFADVFYTVLYTVELLLRIFASGFILHPRAFFRSPWHWLDAAVVILMIMNCAEWHYLWNFTAFRMIRIIKACTYIPLPVRMKLLAKSLLRSTSKLFQVSIIIIYVLFFFALMGLQLFRGELHHRCVSALTGMVTSELCRPVATGQYWFYWGHSCSAGYECVSDAFPNPHYDFRSFDDIGHALLSTFHIMTFQGWTQLLQETNSGVATIAILYYAFVILFCAWFIPSLYLGVFVEKIEKTSRLFVQKQLQLFDGMLLEQRQRLNASVKLRNLVERDESGRLRKNPLYLDSRNSEQNTSTGVISRGRQLSLSDVDSSQAERGGAANSHGGSSVKKRTKWTDEQRVQLHLSLTRQRDISDEAERKKRGGLRLGTGNNTTYISSSSSQNGNHHQGVSGSRPASAQSGKNGNGIVSSTSIGKGGDFALGGRVGAVQHHPSTFTIGTAHGTKLPLAARLESEQERLKFLEHYQSFDNNEMEALGGPNLMRCESSRPPLAIRDRPASHRPGTASGGRGRGEEMATGNILATRESVGVVPSRRSAPRPPSSAGNASHSIHPSRSVASEGSVQQQQQQQQQPTPKHATAQVQPQPQELLINDPEGGDFRYAKTCGERWSIIRNILHMFTEGYPRILTQYLWEHRRMQRRFGLKPLNYVNKYEEAALRKLRQRRARQLRQWKQQQRRRIGDNGAYHDDDDDDEEEDKNDMYNEMNIMKGSGDDYGDNAVDENLSPIRMAKNIIENAPITIFNGIMLCLVFANGVFNASRHYGQPEYWDEGLFYAGVIFTSLFFLELIIRIVAVGPGPFVFSFFNLLDLLVTIIGFFELGFDRSNTITVLNWVRFLRLFRVAPFTPMRRVTRVFLLALPDIIYALVFFSVYMFMWLLIGMSFFGSRTGLLNRTDDDYSTRGRFDTFSQAALAVSQAFSYNRDEWLYMSWDGMRARGGYTIMYFLAVVGVAFIFRYLFIAVFTWAWQCEEEREDNATQAEGGVARGARLRWFDFTVWRSFKHIHGGFERRDVAPDEVYHLNQDMRRQLRIAEVKERFCREVLNVQHGIPVQATTNVPNTHQLSLSSTGGSLAHSQQQQQPQSQHPLNLITTSIPQFVNVGGQLVRQMSMPSEFGASQRPPINAPISQFQAENAQLRFARRYSAVPATTAGETGFHHGPQIRPHAMQPSAFRSSAVSSPSEAALEPSFAEDSNPGSSTKRGLPLTSQPRGSRSVDGCRRSSVTGHFATLDYVPRDGSSSSPRQTPPPPPGDDAVLSEAMTGTVPIGAGTGGGQVYEHILVTGPRLRYKHTMVGRRRRAFDRCMDCGTHQQMPLRAPPNVQQRTPSELHAEHCHMAAVRSSRQLVLNAITGYVRLQKELGAIPTREAVETVLGQAWSCGMLLFETIEYLSCSDIEPRELRTWDRTLEALQLQQWLLGLHVGEEQVGRATLAYILAHQKTQELAATEMYFKRSWRKRSFFVFSPQHPFRRFVTQIVDSWWFEWFILFIIYAASVCLCFYIPRANYSTNKYKALHALDDIFSIIFLVEMLLKWISMGVVLDFHEAYFWYRWNIFDCFITIISLLPFAPQYGRYRYLKVMRCFRILGPLRHCKFNQGLSKIALTMWDCIPTLANVLLLCLVNYVVWAILAVQLFMGKAHYCSNSTYQERAACIVNGTGEWLAPQRNCDNFYQSLLTMFEVSTGSKWLDVAYTGVDGWSTHYAPIMDRRPYKGLFFIAYYYVSNFVLFSLFVASMIYCYLLAKNAAEGIVGITFEHQLWIRMQQMILRLTPRVRLVPMGNVISRFLHPIITSTAFEAVMGCILFCNLITMSLYWHHMSHDQERALDALQYLWVALFTVEVILRLVTHGLRAFTRVEFCFDLFVTCLSYLQIGLNTTVHHRVPFNVNVLRLLRFGRMLKLLRIVLPIHHHLRVLHEVLVLSASALVNVTLILLLGIFVFAVLGMHFIGRIVPDSTRYIDGTYNNFLTFPNALMMTFRLTTLEDWVSMLRSSTEDGNSCSTPDCGITNWAPVFYVPMVICFALMIVSLYIAVVVDHYVTVIRMNASLTRIKDLRRFRKLWSELDPNATLVLRTRRLPELLESLRPPLGLSSRHNRVELMRLMREYDIPDHGGKVHYHEVLIPLARRVLAMAFSEEELDDGGATFEAGWRLSERTLRALPTVLINYSHATVAQYFAAGYVQAAYRRDKASRQLYQSRSDLWHEAREVCDELDLPYANYGFGDTPLDGEDPRVEAVRQGLLSETPEEAEAQRGKGKGESSSPATSAGRPDGTHDGNEGNTTPLAARLPGVYQPAIDEKEKRFGPDVPNAVRRHETRSDKLRRKEEQQQQQQQPSAEGTSAVSPNANRGSRSGHGADYQPPLGTAPESWLSGEMKRRGSLRPSPPQTTSEEGPQGEATQQEEEDKESKDEELRPTAPSEHAEF